MPNIAMYNIVTVSKDSTNYLCYKWIGAGDHSDGISSIIHVDNRVCLSLLHQRLSRTQNLLDGMLETKSNRLISN